MGAASVLGIDRDETLVKKARAALATTFSQTQPVRSGERNGGATAASYSIISDTTSQHGVVIDSMDEEEGGDGVPIGASLLGPRWSVGRTPCASTTTVAVATTDAEARNEGDTAMTASTLAPAPHGHVNVHHFPISMPLLFGRIPWSQHPPVHVRETYPHNVVFETCDIVPGLPGDERVLVGREFDVILAYEHRRVYSVCVVWHVHCLTCRSSSHRLSVTKWIHVHYGDAGMLTFFQRCHDLLAPGGHLLLEPQPWSGYSKLLTASGASVYQVDGPALRLRPGEDGESDNVGTTTFDAVLQQCGFEPGRAVHEPVAASSGFAQRRLWLYRRTS